MTQETVQITNVCLDDGTWSVLAQMFPDASIPVIIGSGNIVHSFRGFTLQDIAYDWAIEFDETIKHLIEDGNHQSIIDYQRLGRAALLSVPTNEHYLPLLYTLSLQDGQESIHFFNEKVTLGTMSMRSVWIG